jgi:hypothetical protein
MDDNAVAKRRRDEEKEDATVGTFKSVFDYMDDDGNINILRYYMYRRYKQRINRQMKQNNEEFENIVDNAFRSH